MTAPTVTDWIDRWEETQLVPADLADRLRTDVAGTGPEPSDRGRLDR
jgi:hypothetical protein